MLRPMLIAAAAFVALVPAASAADYGTPPPVFAGPAPCATIGEIVLPGSKWMHGKKKGEPQAMFYVRPYDPGCPGAMPEQVWVQPQTAFLTSSPTRFTRCAWPCNDRGHRNWYDGKLWYTPAGTPNRPDVFMIIQRD